MKEVIVSFGVEILVSRLRMIKPLNFANLLRVSFFSGARSFRRIISWYSVFYYSSLQRGTEFYRLVDGVAQFNCESFVLAIAAAFEDGKF